MFKVNILDTCSYCRGKAYLLVGESTNWRGEIYIRHQPCPVCEGSGNQSRWVSLTDFAEMLKRAQCKHEHIISQGGTHFSAGDVWDDTEEVCLDCGANLDRQDMGVKIHDDN